ncbi:MAG TPA: hypothetical protein VFN68_07790 [Acidimicrobiales bacterium]|nr:hypothetical protein [Acidimicrobiales bacterium]
MRRHRALPPPTVGPAPARVLIISASMGAGHDGAARTLAEQLRAAGHVAEVRDFLTSGPLRIGSALRSGYEFELRHVPSAYDATYRFWYRVPWLCPLIAWLVTLLTRRKVMRWLREMRPHVVVSTYPLATLCLGRLRRTGRLELPAVNFITDFGVHPLWVHRGIDLNLTIHDGPAVVAAERTGRPTVSTGPAVSERFDPDRLPPRRDARRRFGIADDQRAVLVVAGSWGIGNVGATWEAIAADGRFLPVVVCGRDDRLRRHVAQLSERSGRPSLIIGWTDDMPGLMAACDALVENAGGLTSLEAMRAGLPVVSFDPIAGHGRENTSRMDAAGVARLAADHHDLARILAEVTEAGPPRAQQIARAAAVFRQPPAELVLAATPVPEMPAAGPRSVVSALRLAVGGVALTGICWTGLTTGVAMATEAGAGVAGPRPDSGAVAYMGVRLTAAEMADPTVDIQLRQLGATAVVDDQTAQAAPVALRHLVGQGIGVANGGYGDTPSVPGQSDLPWNRAWRDARAGQAIAAIIGQPVTVTVPGRRLNAWDLVECRNAHTALVVPDHILHAADPDADQSLRLQPRQIYLVNGLDATPAQLAAYLSQLEVGLGAAQLAPAPLANLG